MPTPKPFEITPEDSALFDTLFVRRRNLDCWEWTDKLFNTGYGMMYLSDGRQVLAHRFALQRKVGPPRANKPFVLHQCDNKPCVNPDHLRWGSHAENMAEAGERGLMPSKAKDTCPRGHPMEGANLHEKPFRAKNGKIYINRLCRTCNNELQAIRRRKNKH